MTKQEYIDKYGEDAYQRNLESARKYHLKNKEKLKVYYNNWRTDNKVLKSELSKWHQRGLEHE